MKPFFYDNITEAIEFMQEHEPPEGYYLGFSGGKDSVVLKDLADKSGVKYKPYYSSTGIDPPQLTKYIKKYHPDVEWLRPELSFYEGILKERTPTRNARWCCVKLKEEPSLRIPLKNRLIGIRSEESSKRAKRPRIDSMTKLKGKPTILKPIFYWLEWEIWDYIERNKLPYCELYDEGFNRLGCVICPFICGPKSKQLQIRKKKWPKQYAAFERTMTKKYYQLKERGKKLKEDSPEEFIQNWYNGFWQKPDK